MLRSLHDRGRQAYARSLLPDRGRDQSAAPQIACSTCGSKPANAADNGREWRAQQLHEGAEYKEALAHAQRSAIPGQPLAGLAQAYDCALLMASDCPRFTDTASGWITRPASCG